MRFTYAVDADAYADDADAYDYAYAYAYAADDVADFPFSAGCFANMQQLTLKLRHALNGNAFGKALADKLRVLSQLQNLVIVIDPKVKDHPKYHRPEEFLNLLPNRKICTIEYQ